MIILVLLGIGFLFYSFIPFRLLVLHPFKSVFYFFRDIFFYFYHKDYNRYDGGTLNCYFAHFGGGKTLTVTQYITALYDRYNDKLVFDEKSKSFVVQKVLILSNVHLNNAPYEKLVSLSQILDCCLHNKDIDAKQGTRTCVLVLLDEASSELNSRSFKDNLSPDMINALVTSRHYHMSLFYTSQKFKLVDALLRSVTQKCIHCNKMWRFLVTYYYDADEMEYAINPTLVKPIRRTGFFVSNRAFANYDTLATVDKLKKRIDEKDLLSEEEIINLRGMVQPDADVIVHPSRILKRIKKNG